jgi:PAS domain S-box-containing protein
MTNVHMPEREQKHTVASLSKTHDVYIAQMHDVCRMAADIFGCRSACVVLKHDGVSRLVASVGFPVSMRSLEWDMGKVPYKAHETYIAADAAANPFARNLFSEYMLGEAGCLIRLPLVNTATFAVSLLIFGNAPIKPPTARQRQILADIKKLARKPSLALAAVLVDPDNDITVPFSLAQVSRHIAEAEHALFLLNTDLRIVDCNAAAGILTGLAPKKLVGMKHADFAPETADVVEFLYRRALETLTSPPNFEIILPDHEGHERVYVLSVTPFSPSDVRTYFLLVSVQETTSFTNKAERIGNAITRNAARKPPVEPTQMFLLETLLQKRSIRQRKQVSYLTMRSWRQPVRTFQIKALKALKQNIPPGFAQSIAKEIGAEVSNLFGRAGFKAIVPVPCSHSAERNCLSLEIARSLGAELSLPVVQAFLPQTDQGSSHPKKNARRKPLALARVIAEPVLLVDDVATSGAHIEEAVKLLKPTCRAVMAIAWIGSDSSKPTAHKK